MQTVRMRHADLDDVITVPAAAVPHHAAAGWEPVDEPEQSEKPAPARRRREAAKGEVSE